jgi:hypothetical protein
MKSKCFAKDTSEHVNDYLQYRIAVIGVQAAIGLVVREGYWCLLRSTYFSFFNGRLIPIPGLQALTVNTDA